MTANTCPGKNVLSTHRRISVGEWIMVTGANGYIASHIIDILLQNGYRVRGTLRSHEEAPWLAEFFAKEYGEAVFEVAIVTDLTDSAGFDRAARGMSGIVHSASILPSTSDVDAVVPHVVAGTRNALDAAAKSGSVRSFVLTSSSIAACMPEFVKPNVVVDEYSWNQGAPAAAYSKETPAEALPLMIYAASKTLGERALWDWVAWKHPHFSVNAVLPNFNMGKPLCPKITTSSMPHVLALLDGAKPRTDIIQPQYFVHVRDNARLHVAALLDPTVQSERLFAFAEQFNWNDVVGILRRLEPDNKSIPDGPKDEPRDLTNVDKVRRRAEALLKSNFGVMGWTGLEESLTEALKRT
ncbi:uncharacterized protein A1O9_00719 [Exophiala aquamarina CBS 119918]|uniref:NAD-dependent epimerase/dehydratase domain-containing protein n=1 Tax=Exophiala aquamarina CBS 119918 TaxID=1182545 RepID=A0A072PSC3_9EURO|nr:uncharacterized protein A1O9_00719 [Exophiala aquamarina CBS 119918]KEF62746.1 hypothetical protein A1O9_00719 [Exophiala aquamarina CBS 119918]